MTVWARARGLTAAKRKPSRREAWRQAAQLAGAEFLPGASPREDRVLVKHGAWRIWLDTYVVSTGQTAVTYTRVRAYFLGLRDLRLVVRRRNALDRLVEALGFGSRPPVSRALNERYVVRGKPPGRVPSLFSGMGLGEEILAVPSLRLEIKRPSRKSRRRFGQDSGVVVCRTTGVVRDPERLASMLRVVREALDALRRVGEADDREVPQ